MRFLLAAIFSVLFIATVAMPGNGTRLDTLYRKLQTVENLHEAGLIQAMIRHEWMVPQTGRPALALLMDAAETHIRQQEYDRAIAAMDEAIRLAPFYAEAWNRRATAFYGAGNYPAAVADIAQTLRLEPRHYAALSGLGMINLAMGRMEPALEAYEAALRINPHLMVARRHVEAIMAALQGESL